MRCSTALGRMLFPLFSAALQNRLKAGLCHCNYTYGDLLCIQVCSEAAQMHCSTGFCKMQSPLFSNALQNRLTAGMCHCNYTYGAFIFVQVCSVPTAALVFATYNPHYSVLLCKTGSQQACVTAITSKEIWSSYRCAVSQLQHWFLQDAIPTIQCCSAKQAHSRLVPPQSTLWRFALHTGVQ